MEVVDSDSSAEPVEVPGRRARLTESRRANRARDPHPFIRVIIHPPGLPPPGPAVSRIHHTGRVDRSGEQAMPVFIHSAIDSLGSVETSF